MKISLKSTAICGDLVFFVAENDFSLIDTARLQHAQCVQLDQYLLSEIVNPGETVMIDVGGSIGMAALQAAKLGAAAVYSFEPNPRDRMALEALSKSWSAIKVVPFGLSDVSGTAFLNTKAPLGCARIVDADQLSDDLIEIQTLTLDDFVDTNQLKVDIIKIDTEGWEKQVLMGASKTINKDKPVIVMSAYHKPDDATTLPEVVRQICSDYGEAEFFPADGDREATLKMKAN